MLPTSVRRLSARSTKDPLVDDNVVHSRFLGQPQNGSQAPETRRFSSPATSTRLLLLSARSTIERRSSLHTPSHGRSHSRRSASANPAGYPNGKSNPTSTVCSCRTSPQSSCLISAIARTRVEGFSSAATCRRVPVRAIKQYQMLSAPVAGRLLALQSTIRYASNSGIRRHHPH
jgi:hypothetical protein